MATPPTLASGGGNTLGTGWSSGSWTVTTLTQTASITTAVGDVVVLGCMAEGGALTWTGVANTTGTAETWTKQTSQTANGPTSIWTCIATAAQTSTVTVTISGSGQAWGFEFWVFRGSSGVTAGDATWSRVSTTTGQLSHTFTGSNSAGIIIASDSNAGSTSPTWLTVNGSAMTTSAFKAYASHYGVYAGHRLDRGAAGTVILGMSAPSSGTTFGISGVEILGSGAAAPYPFGVTTPTPRYR